MIPVSFFEKCDVNKKFMILKPEINLYTLLICSKVSFI